MSLKETLFRRKSMQQLTAEEAEGPKLNKILNWRDVFNHGVAAIIGTGIFVLTGVAAHDHAGPAIILSFVLAGLACAFVALSYAELASMIPLSGSAYTYAYATLGEIIAWIIGWDLLLEYAVGASAVAVGWSAYLQNVLHSVGIYLPDGLAHAPAVVPWPALVAACALLGLGIYLVRRAYLSLKASVTTAGIATAVIGCLLLLLGGERLFEVLRHGVDIFAVAIILFINYWLVKGVKHTARMTAIFVGIKLAVILLFIGIGVWHIQPTNWVPFFPFGFHGVITGAGIVFFAYIGFDAVTTLAEECKDPQRDVPKGVLGSLVVCTLLYLVVAGIMTGAMSYTLLGGSEAAAPMARVLDYLGYWWASPLVSFGAIAGITSVLIVLLFGQSRIMMKMSQDGLFFPVFGKISARFRTPVWSILILGVFAAAFAGLIPIGELAELTNIGTLAAFVLVCVGVIVLRKREPEQLRRFRCPEYAAVPPVLLGLSLLLLPILAIFCPLPAVAVPLLGLATLPVNFWVLALGSLAVLSGGCWGMQRLLGYPWIPVMGAVMSFGLMLGLPGLTWLRFVVWMGIGLVIYGLYGRRHSTMNDRPSAGGGSPELPPKPAPEALPPPSPTSDGDKD